MPTESATIIIDADDRASRKIAQAAANAERAVKQIKDTGQKAKASTEFFGQLANALGGSQLAGYAGQLAGLTEKTGQFAEVSKAGAAGAIAFKLGLVGMAAAITYQVTTAIASLIYEVDKLETKMKRAAESQADSLNKLSETRMRIQRERIEDVDLRAQLSGSGADPTAERVRVQQELRAEIAKSSAEIRKAQAEIDAYEAKWIKLDNVEKAFIETEKARVQALKSGITQMEAFEQQLRSELSSRQQTNDAIRKQIEAQKEAEQMRQKAIDDAASDQQRKQDLLQKETDRLEEQRIELEKGTEAARAFALEKEGLSKADAQRLAAEQTAIDKLRDARKDAEKDNQQSFVLGNQAVQSRLLTRGPLEKTAEKQVKVLEQIRDKLPLHSTPSQRQVIEVVG